MDNGRAHLEGRIPPALVVPHRSCTTHAFSQRPVAIPGDPVSSGAQGSVGESSASQRGQRQGWGHTAPSQLYRIDKSVRQAGHQGPPAPGQAHRKPCLANHSTSHAVRPCVKHSEALAQAGSQGLYAFPFSIAIAPLKDAHGDSRAETKDLSCPVGPVAPIWARIPGDCSASPFWERELVPVSAPAILICGPQPGCIHLTSSPKE
jgi:hypothetical protein